MKAIHQNSRITTIKFIAIIALLFFTTQQVRAICPVSADFTFQKVGNTVTFTPIQNADTLTWFSWNFGDGNFSTFKGIVSNEYVFSGNYNVRLQIIGRDPIDTSIRCSDVKFDTIFIEDSIPCVNKNSIINTTLYFPDNNIGVGFCADYNNCLFPNSFTVLGDANHGSITDNGTSCFLYNSESIGADTLKIVSCNAINNCDTTTHIINILQRTECNRIAEDSIFLQLESNSVSYCTPFPSGRYFIANQNSNYFNPYSNCTPNNLSIQFFQAGINNITIIDSINNCFENVVIVVIDSAQIIACQKNNSIIIRDTFYQNQINTNWAYCLPVLCTERPNPTIVGTFKYGNLYITGQAGCLFYNFTSFGADSFYVEYSGNGPFKDTVYFYFTISSDDSVAFCDTTTCLLPGDSDHDLTVNNYDALAIGLSYNRTGIIRPNATTQYTLQPCDDWNTTHYYGYNDKFADCNGDGRINSLDAVVISQNYIAQAQNYFNHRQSNLDSLPAVTLVFDTLPTTVVNGNCDGAEIVADILVGSAAQPIINGYGVAFSVNYPFENDTCFNVQVDLDPNSWLQTNNPVLLFYKDIPQFKRVDISVVRTDGLPRSGNGRIGKIKMITEGAVFRNGLRLSTPPIFDFSVTDVAAINHIGQRIDVNGSTTTVSFIVLGTIKNKVDGLKFYPNPTTGKIYINAKETIQSIRIFDTQGRIIDELSINKNDIQVDISTVESGMYILEIKGNNSVSYEKIFKQ